jgi:hypothetical protein
MAMVTTLFGLSPIPGDPWEQPDQNLIYGKER